MSNYIIYETLKKPIDIVGDGSALVTAIGHINTSVALREESASYERRDLFAKSFRILPTNDDKIISIKPTVYIQDSIERQHGGKITSFISRINEVINDARDIKKLGKQIAPYDWHEKPYQPSITVSVKCDDTKLGPKSNRIISTLNDALESGIKIEFVNKCAADSPWNTVIQSMLSHSK